MLTKAKLMNAVLIICGLGIVFSFMGRHDIAIAFMVANIVLMGLRHSISEDKITLRVKNLFDDNLQVNEFLAKMKTDAEFAQAVTYVFKLSTNDVLAFGRLIVELRAEADQKLLAQFASIFRKEQP